MDRHKVFDAVAGALALAAVVGSTVMLVGYAQTPDPRVERLERMATEILAMKDEQPDLADVNKVDADETVARLRLFAARLPRIEPPPPPPPPVPPTWGVLSADIMGNCTIEAHERYVVDGGDGFQYRMWHPQTVPLDLATPGVTCTFAHEHGDDPSKQLDEKVRAVPIRFGYIGHYMPMPTEPNGHEEPHEGFKVYVANKGQKNNEGRLYLHDSRIVFHMGTGGPKRFITRMHSFQYVLRTAPAGVLGERQWASIQVMGDTGGVGSIDANPRQGKTVMMLGQKPVDSLYEIWEATGTIRSLAGVSVFRAAVSSAVFDPITAYDPASPTDAPRLLYMWDSAINAIVKFPGNSRTGVRGCDREAYHGPVSIWDQRRDATVYMTDAMGQEVANGPLKQEVSKFRQTTNFIATNDGLSQFKNFSKNCTLRPQLGFKN